MDALAQTGLTIGMGIAGLWAGRALADAYPLDALPALPMKRLNPAISHACAIAIGSLFWIGSAILCGLHSPFRHVTFALVLCPPGAWIRWQLSRFNPARKVDDRVLVRQWMQWPLGTNPRIS